MKLLALLLLCFVAKDTNSARFSSMQYSSMRNALNKILIPQTIEAARQKAIAAGAKNVNVKAPVVKPSVFDNVVINAPKVPATMYKTKSEQDARDVEAFIKRIFEIFAKLGKADKKSLKKECEQTKKDVSAQFDGMMSMLLINISKMRKGFDKAVQREAKNVKRSFEKACDTMGEAATSSDAKKQGEKMDREIKVMITTIIQLAKKCKKAESSPAQSEDNEYMKFLTGSTTQSEKEEAHKSMNILITFCLKFSIEFLKPARSVRTSMAGGSDAFMKAMADLLASIVEKSGSNGANLDGQFSALEAGVKNASGDIASFDQEEAEKSFEDSEFCFKKWSEQGETSTAGEGDTTPAAAGEGDTAPAAAGEGDTTPAAAGEGDATPAAGGEETAAAGSTTEGASNSTASPTCAIPPSDPTEFAGFMENKTEEAFGTASFIFGASQFDLEGSEEASYSLESTTSAITLLVSSPKTLKTASIEQQKTTIDATLSSLAKYLKKCSSDMKIVLEKNSKSTKKATSTAVAIWEFGMKFVCRMILLLIEITLKQCKQLKIAETKMQGAYMKFVDEFDPESDDWMTVGEELCKVSEESSSQSSTSSTSSTSSGTDTTADPAASGTTSGTDTSATETTTAAASETTTAAATETTTAAAG